MSLSCTVCACVAKEASVVVGESEANKRKNKVSIELARVLPSYVGQGLLKCDGRSGDRVIGVVAPVCVRAEQSSLARVCWQRVEQRQRRANRDFCFLLLFVVV